MDTRIGLIEMLKMLLCSLVAWCCAIVKEDCAGLMMRWIE
jgi:hypothetical protein